MMLFVVTYHHRHGVDVVYLGPDGAPDMDAVADGLDDWEPDRDEYLELHGPIEVEGLDKEG